MTNDLSKLRKSEMSRDSTVSEIQLRQSHAGVKDKWDKLQAVKQEIAIAKQDALNAIDAQYKPLLEAAERQYAVMVKLVRK